MKDLETINKSEGGRAVPTDWIEHYLGILRKEIQIPEVQKNIQAKAEIQQKKIDLGQKAEQVHQEIAELHKRQDEIIATSLGERMTAEIISEAATTKVRIEALQNIEKEIKQSSAELDEALEIARAGIFHSASRVFKLAQIGAQERLDDDLRDLANRVKSWDDALDRVGNEIEAYHHVFYLSQNSSLNCKSLLKILKI